MTPAARAEAAIELLDAIIAAAREGGAAADTLIARYFRTRRYAGSKDRRAVRDLVFRAIRRAGERPVSGRAALLGLAEDAPELRALFDGSAHGPAPLEVDEPVATAGIASLWLLERFDPALQREELGALLDRAPLDLRVNRLKGTRAEAVAAFPEARETPHAPLGLRLPEGAQVEQSEVWTSGLVEVQDEGSQLLALGCSARPGATIVDLCAGAGGKTLALAADMTDQGRIVASDTDRARLARMAPRLDRAGVSIIEARLLDPNREAEALADLAGASDLVLVDAPCSGTGTWRRNPEARWRLTPERLARFVKLQSHLLDVAVELVAPDGHLVYAVCSLLGEEGREQAAAFEARHSAFVRETVPITAGTAAGPGRLLSPARDGTDGFFIARWRRAC
ncbi:RsmB/NOP family class I SAM-dependent RNA methyltransferase [Sphingosinicella sp. LHD-64]|uniref:RsmB/NOP family class I SAM-dependent RNA methyltransferase n=1 Tax=Sphingosinicella sp. LHD-64 TaxID=3072139 RepID=UPI00280F9DCF|nr:RsmB/NOP family class I SAM-dependent RNA methyltransferase [Sphingosinicella sp. LHD-64]MDQ8755004.1 RsmB/NOP family class I SAM-dependent RNA methyltransferase [Sphingosinicella sp. LHD-64]